MGFFCTWLNSETCVLVTCFSVDVSVMYFTVLENYSSLEEFYSLGY